MRLIVTARFLLRLLVSVFFFLVGTGHFLLPGPFVAIVPPYLPEPLLLVYASGFFEILGAVGLMISRLRHVAGWGLIALLVAVLPANIYMLVSHPYLAGHVVPIWILWLRLPMQFVLIAAVWWVAGLGRTPARRDG